MTLLIKPIDLPGVKIVQKKIRKISKFYEVNWFDEQHHMVGFVKFRDALISLTLIQLWKIYPLIQFCGVRTDPGDYSELNVILHHGKGHDWAKTFFPILWNK